MEPPEDGGMPMVLSGVPDLDVNQQADDPDDVEAAD